MLGARTSWFNGWALLAGMAVGTTAGTAMAVAVNLNWPIAFSSRGYVFPGYTALYALILNLTLVIVLAPLFNALSARRTSVDDMVLSDYHA